MGFKNRIESRNVRHLEATQVVLLLVVVESLRRIPFFETLWTATCQGPLSMGLPRQEYWSGSPFPSPGDLPVPRIKSTSLALAGGSLLLSHQGCPCNTALHFCVNSGERSQLQAASELWLYRSLCEHILPGSHLVALPRWLEIVQDGSIYTPEINRPQI